MMNALRLVFVWQTIFVFLVITRPTLGIELLDDSSEQDTEHSLEGLNGVNSHLELAKDTIYKRNPANEGNALKTLWEDIPEELAEDYIKHVSKRDKQTKLQQIREIDDKKK